MATPTPILLSISHNRDHFIYLDIEILLIGAGSIVLVTVRSVDLLPMVPRIGILTLLQISSIAVAYEFLAVYLYSRLGGEIPHLNRNACTWELNKRYSTVGLSEGQ